MNIFVGNLSFDATKADVKKAFECFGSVVSVVIVMDKQWAKSRGFGFVEMPDDQQAQAAIAALDGKEFMGRPLNVGLARTKAEVGSDNKKRKKILLKIKAESQRYPRTEKDRKNDRIKPVIRKAGAYKGGRRSRSFMIRRAAAGIEEQDMPQRKTNPMRWLKKREQPKSRGKTEGKSKPWRKSNERLQQSRVKRRKSRVAIKRKNEEN
ncbi:MAG: hypothetical protein ABIC18_04970 [Candidatus Omnitrophota bacterium]